MPNRGERLVRSARRVVVKLGSNLLTCDTGLDLEIIRSISSQVSGLVAGGFEVILVSSGAVAVGVKKIGLPGRPDSVPMRQAAAAVGQAGLMMEYETAFGCFDRRVAQVLLTAEDLAHRSRFLNARNTLQVLLSWGVIPIINENDTVAIEEIKFGDNDNLAALIALMADADLLINLTDIDGLFDRDPRRNPDATFISWVDRIDTELENAAGGIPGTLGTGGMLTKLKAARKVMAAGIPMVIARGHVPDVIHKVMAGETIGTYFAPSLDPLSKKKSWISFSAAPRGRILIDDGAVAAVVQNGKSLLPSGIVAVENDFRMGAAVSICNARGENIGIGLVNYNATDIRRIMGLKTDRISDVLGEKPYDEVIHRNNMGMIGKTG